MAAIPGFRLDITGASGSQGLLSPRNGWQAYVFQRGGNAAQDSTGTLITFDSSDIASRFAVNNWVQVGTATSKIVKVTAVGGNSISVNAAVVVTENDRVFLIGNTQPSVSGGSASYITPNTLIRQRGDDAADLYANSKITTNSDGLVQGYASPAMYDVMVQDGNQSNQGYIADLEVGTVEGVSVVDWAFFGQTVTIHGALGVTGTAFFGSTVTINANLLTDGLWTSRYASGFVSGSSTGGIQEAINALPTSGGVVVLSGASTYSPTVAITLGSSVTIDGNGAIIQRSASNDALSIFKDSGSAIANVLIRNVVFDNASRAATAEDILLTGGCTDIRVEGCRWVNLINRTEDLARISTSATKGSRISFRNNTVVGPGAQQNFNSFQVFDCDNVDVSGNIVDGWGAIKIEGSLSPSLFNWSVLGNRLKNIAQTNVFCRIQGSASVSSVSVADNVITDAGKTAMAIGAINAGDTGTLNRVSISGNVITGFALSAADSAIAVGGNVTGGTVYMNGVAVTGNVIDGLDSTGARPTDQGRGIIMRGGIQDFSVTGNIAKNCGRAGIAVQGAKDGAVTGNVVDKCVAQDTTLPSSATEGGIVLYGDNNYPTTGVIISNNVSKNNGVSGTTISYGINVVSDGAVNISKILVHGNRCYDDQTTHTQDYGIKIGANGVAGPNDSIIHSNDCRGNSTGGVLGPLGTVTGVYLQSSAVYSTANLTQATSLALPDGDFFGVSGTLGAGTSISTMTPLVLGREVMLWAAQGTMGFSQSNVLKIMGASFNVPVNGAVKAKCTGTTWFIFSPSS